MSNARSNATPNGLRSAALTDTGKVRQHNEDAFTCLQEDGLYIVSDGMGGRNAGATAAKVVVDELPQMIKARVDPSTKPPEPARKISHCS